MKRVRILTLALTLIALAAGSASAQNWFGLRTGYPLGVTVHYGMSDTFANGFDARISANLRVRGERVSFGVGVDALNTVSVEGPFNLYVGFGPALDFGGGGALIDLHVLGGGEFRFTDLGLDPLGVFAEVSLGAGLGLGRPSQIPTFGGAVGFNYRF